MVETAALFAIGTLTDATAALFITGRGLRRPRSEGESPPRCAVRKNSCKSLLDIRNLSSPGIFFAGVTGGGITVAGTFATAGVVVFVTVFAFVAVG